jgi:hypothetical protein
MPAGGSRGAELLELPARAPDGAGAEARWPPSGGGFGLLLPEGEAAEGEAPPDGGAGGFGESEEGGGGEAEAGPVCDHPGPEEAGTG